MPPSKRFRRLTAALVGAAALTFWLAPRFAPAGAAVPLGSEVRFAFSSPFYRVSEADGVATVTVLRTGDTAREASVDYLADSGYLQAKGCAYLAWVGSATPGSDYTRASGTLRFAAGETSKTFQVPILEDALVESREPETVFLSLDFSALAPADGADCYGSTATLYIHDDDPAPTPTPTPAETGKRRIAFTSDRDGNYEIYSMDEDGANVRRLTNNLEPDGHPSWSPDGKRLAFVSSREGPGAIYLMNADGSNVVRIPNVTGNVAEPAWSPDGTKVAYTAYTNSISYSTEIYVANADGTGTPVNVTNNVGEDFEPAWSPDGGRIAFTSRRDNGTYSVYVMNADGTGVRRVVDSYSRDPAWSPDGTKIAYAEGVDLRLAVAVVGADGTNKRLLTPATSFAFDSTPAWSSDGARIAFATNRDAAGTNNSEIYAMNADGTGLTRVTSNTSYDGAPAWQPQSRQPAAAPALLTEPGTNWAVALDSVTQVADPFPVVAGSNFSADRRTRVSLFATGVTSPAAADITAEAEDSNGRRYALAVEHAASVPGLDWLTQVNVRLPDELEGLDYVWVTLNVRGTITNRAVITLKGGR